MALDGSTFLYSDVKKLNNFVELSSTMVCLLLFSFNFSFLNDLLSFFQIAFLIIYQYKKIILLLNYRSGNICRSSTLYLWHREQINISIHVERKEINFWILFTNVSLFFGMNVYHLTVLYFSVAVLLLSGYRAVLQHVSQAHTVCKLCSEKASWTLRTGELNFIFPESSHQLNVLFLSGPGFLINFVKVSCILDM